MWEFAKQYPALLFFILLMVLWAIVKIDELLLCVVLVLTVALCKIIDLL